MTDWQVIFLGVMAVALVVMAVTQVMTSLALLRASREMSGAVQRIQRDLGPLIDKATRMTDDAARVAELARVQVERIDQLVVSLSQRIDETMATVQSAIIQPMKHGATVVAAFQAVFAAIREWQGRRGGTREDEDPLFVG